MQSGSITKYKLYYIRSTVRFRPESGNSAEIAPESAGITRIHRNGTRIAWFLWNSTGMAPEFVTKDSQDSFNLLYLINKVYFWLFILFYIQFKLIYTN